MSEEYRKKDYESYDYWKIEWINLKGESCIWYGLEENLQRDHRVHKIIRKTLIKKATL